MHNPKVELVKRSAELAKEKHPKGFNKSQLIASSKEVFGGYGEEHSGALVPHKPIRTMEDVGNAGNAMAFIDGGYPTGMGTCYVVVLAVIAALNALLILKGIVATLKSSVLMA